MYMNLNEENLEDCLKFLTEKDIEYIDAMFKPDEVRFCLLKTNALLSKKIVKKSALDLRLEDYTKT
jgi:hypothetical protein